MQGVLSMGVPVLVVVSVGICSGSCKYLYSAQMIVTFHGGPAVFLAGVGYGGHVRVRQVWIVFFPFFYR